MPHWASLSMLAIFGEAEERTCVTASQSPLNLSLGVLICVFKCIYLPTIWYFGREYPLQTCAVSRHHIWLFCSFDAVGKALLRDV
jgi:hypothetical protein